MFDYKKLTYIMEEKKLTNKAIAEIITKTMGIKISESAFKNYRQGKSNPSLKILSAMSKVLNIKEQDLLRSY